MWSSRSFQALLAGGETLIGNLSFRFRVDEDRLERKSTLEDPHNGAAMIVHTSSPKKRPRSDSTSRFHNVDTDGTIVRNHNDILRGKDFLGDRAFGAQRVSAQHTTARSHFGEKQPVTMLLC